MKKLKCLAALAAAGALLSTVFCTPAFASPASVQVSVTIANGTLCLAQEGITVSDTDGDGELAINDALACAHEQKSPGAAAAGYKTEATQWGLSLMKLWGVANGGSYGYYVNNTAAWSLTDEVKTGDSVAAFVYQDTSAFSDMYCSFDRNTVSAKAGENFTLTLTGQSYDAAQQKVVSVPVKGAAITIDGEKTSFVTDADGKAVIQVASAKNCVISAVSDDSILVPPCCLAAIAENPEASSDSSGVSSASSGSSEVSSAAAAGSEAPSVPKTGDSGTAVLFVTVGALSAAAALMLCFRRRYEN